VRRLRDEAARLERFPEIGRVVPEHADPNIRELIVSPYRLIYRYLPARNRVQIIAVVHSSRQLPPLSERT
jgi:plasmid stabilization system protein ParE